MAIQIVGLVPLNDITNEWRLLLKPSQRFMMRLTFWRLITVALLLLASGAGRVRAAEWQWSVTVDSVVSPETQAHPRAFLWIPPDCRRVRAVVVGQHNLIEEGILEDTAFRREIEARTQGKQERRLNSQRVLQPI